MKLLPVLAAALVACGTDVPSTDEAGAEAGADVVGDALADAPDVPDVSVPCGSTTCDGAQVCIVSCTGNFAYCDAPTDAGTCPPNEHFASSCAYGPGAGLDGGGCSNVVYSYKCAARTGDTVHCASSGQDVTIQNGVAMCCFD